MGVVSQEATVAASTSNYVYVLSDQHAWVPARVLSMSENGEIHVAVSHYEDEQSIQSGKASGNDEEARRAVIRLSHYPSRALPLQNVDQEGCLREVEDMVELAYLHEAAILYNIKARHIRGKPYTRCGDIVLAVNPYQWLNDLYSDAKRRAYARALVWEAATVTPSSSSLSSPSSTHSMDPRSMVEPHVYETSAMAYRGLAVEGQNQSILVSGESGAGKTETVKILLSHLASIQESTASNKAQTSLIVQRVLDSNPLLEAFGNAKTVRNDNSSRFGKFLQLQFDAEDPTMASYEGKLIPDCTLAGSICEAYLLEKSRVVGHEDNERTYHIFYQLLAAPVEMKTTVWEEGLVGTDNESFAYVGWTDTSQIEGLTDAERFGQTCKALALIGIVGESLLTLLRCICIVLQLGNLLFDEDKQDEEKAEIVSEAELSRLARLMGIEEAELYACLTSRTVKAGGEDYKVPLNAVKSKDSCDAFAKEIYAKMFLWLVRTINDATCAEKNYGRNGVSEYGLIGLLDIFGFESFAINRFEQLCINYANEKLQQKFTNDVFRSVKQEYEFEGIELAEITYTDNQNVLSLVEGTTGLISILNEECVRPKGNDSAFVSKVKSMNERSDCLIAKKIFRDQEFGVRHYAGPVIYNANGFVSKNTDMLPPDLSACARKCTNDIVRRELTNDDSMSFSPQKKQSKSPSKRLLRRKSSIVAETVWTKFRNQLVTLMYNLSATRTRYIRCIKPNTGAKPFLMQHGSTVEQLRCAGVVAAVTISRSAFPNRVEHEDILRRFRSLWAKGEDRISPAGADSTRPTDEVRHDVDRLLGPVLQDLETIKNGSRLKAYVIGKTRTYFRAGGLEHLEAERLSGLGKWAIVIQRSVRGLLVRRLAARMAAGCIVLQCWTRCALAKREFSRRDKDRKSTLIVALFRMVVARRAFRRQKQAKKEQRRREAEERTKRELAAAPAAIVVVAATTTAGAYQEPESVEVSVLEKGVVRTESNTELTFDDKKLEMTEEPNGNESAPELDLESGDLQPEDIPEGVSDEFENGDMAKAVPTQSGSWCRQHRKLLIIVGLLLVVALGAGAGIGVALSGSDNSEGGSSTGGYQPPDLLDFLVENTPSDELDFDDPESYQSRTFDWLANDPDLPTYPPFRVLRRYGLGCIYHSTYAVPTVVTDVITGNSEAVPGWTDSTNWMTSTDECGWFGIACTNGLIVELNLRNNSLTGSFPAESAVLAPELLKLDLGQNSVWNQGDAGNAFLGTLTSLEVLLLDNTFFENEGIPTYIGLLTNLVSFDCLRALYDGPLRGDTFSNLQNLVNLDISSNNVGGSVPPEIVALPNLRFFYAIQTGLTGGLSFMTDLKAMDEIWVDNNPDLGGPIPTELSRVPTLASVSLIGSSITGSLPTELGLVSNLYRFWVSNNTLTGPVPSEMGRLQRLELFELDENEITGIMPPAVCALTLTGSLEQLLSDCEGPVPEIDCRCCNNC